VTFYFKDINGTDKSLNEIAQTTNKPVSEIEISIDEAEIVKPQIGTNTVITSCCDERLSYVISGQYNVGATLYTVGITESYCWYAESLTDQFPTVPETITFTNGGRSCAECVRLNPCPSPCEEMSLGYTEGRTNPPSDACSASQLIYEYDGNEGVLYQQGQCGNSKADRGYYSDGIIIYFVDIDGNMNEVGPCPRPFEGPWVTGISVIDQFGMTGQYPSENLYLDYTANGDMSTIITSFNLDELNDSQKAFKWMRQKCSILEKNLTSVTCACYGTGTFSLTNDLYDPNVCFLNDINLFIF
jgi:hypothetical protein